MPQFGSYTDGAPGQTGDEIVVKRSGTGTVRLALDKLPVSEAASAAFVGATTFNTFQENTDASLALKENILTFVGATKVGSTVTIDPDLIEVTGRIADGKSFALIPNTSSFNTHGPNIASSSITGTVASIGPNNPTNVWNERGRATVTGTAAANNQVKVIVAPRVRFPETTTSLYGGFKIVATWTSGESNSNAVGGFGFWQTIPSAGTAPSAYTGGRWGFWHDPAFGDQNLKLYNGATLLQDLGASFPGGGSAEANPYQLEFICRPFPNYGMEWRITHITTGATASGTTTSIPLGTWNINVGAIRDSQATATAPVIVTTGIYGGAFYDMVVGDSSSEIPAPLTLTGNTTLTKVTYAEREVFADSASPVTFTVDPTGYVAGDTLYGINLGAGTVAFAAGSGVTINQHADVSATVPQYKGWSLRCVATNTWVRLS